MNQSVFFFEKSSFAILITSKNQPEKWSPLFLLLDENQKISWKVPQAIFSAFYAPGSLNFRFWHWVMRTSYFDSDILWPLQLFDSSDFVNLKVTDFDQLLSKFHNQTDTKLHTKQVHLLMHPLKQSLARNTMAAFVIFCPKIS